MIYQDRQATEMAEIKLNKPLYKEEAPATAGEVKAPRPRGACPALLARIGAIVLDVLALHAISMAFIGVAPAAAVRFGDAGPWIGIAVAFACFSICNSPLTGGRSLGKYVLRMRVSEIAGPDLPVNKALARSALLVWPLAVYLLLAQYSEAVDKPDQLSVMTGAWIIGLALAAGWYAGNVFYAWASPDKRTWYDHLAGSVVVNADCGHEALQEYLARARQQGASADTARARLLLLGCMGGLLLLAGWRLYADQQSLVQLAPDIRARIDDYRKLADVPGFRFRPVYSQPSTTNGDDATSNPADSDSKTTTVAFQYVRRGPVTSADVEANPAAMGAADRLARFYKEEFRGMLERGEKITTLPERLRFETRFAEQSDLLFAWSTTDIFKRAVIARFPNAGETTTGTAAAMTKETIAPVRQDSPATSGP